MPTAGLEPARPFELRILSPLRLPFRQAGTARSFTRGGSGTARGNADRVSAGELAATGRLRRSELRHGPKASPPVDLRQAGQQHARQPLGVDKAQDAIEQVAGRSLPPVPGTVATEATPTTSLTRPSSQIRIGIRETFATISLPR